MPFDSDFYHNSRYLVHFIHFGFVMFIASDLFISNILPPQVVGMVVCICALCLFHQKEAISIVSQCLSCQLQFRHVRFVEDVSKQSSRHVLLLVGYVRFGFVVLVFLTSGFVVVVSINCCCCYQQIALPIIKVVKQYIVRFQICRDHDICELGKCSMCALSLIHI